MAGIGEIVALAKGLGGSGGGSSGGGVLVVHNVEGTLDKTWQEIHDAMAAGQIPVVGYVDGNDAGITIIGWASFLKGTYALYGLDNSLLYSASSANDYPVFQGE